MPMKIALGLGAPATMLAAPCLDAQNVLIINGSSGTSEPSTTSSITTQLSTLHAAVGNIVTIADGRPADLSPYR